MSTSRIPASQRHEFRAFRRIPTRWADNDLYGHVNNVVYYTWFDTAINSMLIEEGVLDLHGGSIAKRRMRTLGVVVVAPVFDLLAGMPQRAEPMQVQVSSDIQKWPGDDGRNWSPLQLDAVSVSGAAAGFCKSPLRRFSRRR